MQRIFLLILFFSMAIIPLEGLGQWRKDYPKGYFKWPVGAEPAIVANFGELRRNHFHMGLDGRTGGKENFPILAAADGYIAKVKIEPFGFGRCIYINHPNGFTTVYAHLNNFYPELERYVRQRQYSLQQWKVFLEDIPPQKFQVKKGDFIAYSGNTGGSQGPHLHFEIRDTKTDKALNPMLFDMPITDRIPPAILKLAWYDREKSTYEQIPSFLNLRKIGAVYVTDKELITVPAGKISFGITSFDKYTGSTNQNGIYRATIYEGSKKLCLFELDGISYDETRGMNAHIDHRTKFMGGPYIQHLSRLPGYAAHVYQERENSGLIDLSDGDIHDIRIEVEDANLNKSIIKLSVQSTGKKNNDSKASGILFRPDELNVYESEDLRLYIPENYIYDSFHFRHNKTVIAGRISHQIHHPMVPLHDYISISIKPEIPFDDTSRVIMKRSHADKDDYKKAVMENGWYKASFREFGLYELFEDRESPVVTPIGFRDGMNTSGLKKISFSATDNAENIRFTGLLDGQWILFSNDKGKIFTYAFDEHCSKGKHELILTAEDMAGNKTNKKYSFTR